MSTLKRAARRWTKRALSGLLRATTGRRVDLPPSVWRLEPGPDGALQLDGVSLRALAGRWGSPLHVVDGSRLAENAAAFLEVPAGAARGCEIYYSYKTNPLSGVLRRLYACGVGAEVTSAHELWIANRLGVPASRTIFNGPSKSPGALADAIARDLGLINLNGAHELPMAVRLARELGKRPRVGLRVVTEGSWSGQLGEPIAGGAALAVYAEALATPGLRVAGLHAHRGGEIATAAHLELFLSQVLAFCDLLRDKLGLELEMLDLGGSLASPTVHSLGPRSRRFNQAFGLDLMPRPPSQVLSIREYVAAIVKRVEGHYRRRGRPAPRVLLEPGRALTGNTQLLLGRVLHLRDRERIPTYAILDAGINLAGPVITEYHQVHAVGPARSDQRRVYRLVGPLCTPADLLYPAWELPELASGDLIVILDTGAYFLPSSTSFSFPQPGVALVADGKATLLRRAETSEDLIARDQVEGDVSGAAGTEGCNRADGHPG
jgi:diaminopimelate decarboxylase